MVRFIQLEIKGPKTELQNLLAQWKDNIPKGWKYDKAKSRDMAMNSLYLYEEEWSVFKAPKKLYDSSVFVVYDGEYIRVANITSNEYFSLGKERYNEVLTAFYKDFAEPNTNNQLKVHISSAEQSLEELVNRDTANKLRIWEATCNKGDGGICNPFDREKWFDFIITAAHTHSSIDLDILEQWLVEEQKWPSAENEEDHRTKKLLSYYEFGRDLIEYYEKNIHK